MKTRGRAVVFLALWAQAGCETSESPRGAPEVETPDADFFRFDFQHPDAAPPPPDAAPVDPALCNTPCELLADCAAADDEAHVCDGIDAREREAFLELCLQVCAAQPTLVTDFEGLMACDEVLVQMRAVSPNLAYACVPFPPPELAPCRSFGARAAECVSAACDAAASVSAGLALWLSQSCEQSVAAGQLGLEDVGRLPGPETPCDDPVAAGVVQSLVGTEGDPRALTTLCTVGPVLPPGRCEAACEHLGPCLPSQHALRNLDYCAFVCALDEGLRDALSCAALAPDCGPVSTCFGG